MVVQQSTISAMFVTETAPAALIAMVYLTALLSTMSVVYVRVAARHARTAWVSYLGQLSTILVGSAVTIQVGLTVGIALMLCLAQQR